MIKKIGFFYLLMTLLVSCSLSEPAIRTSISKTQSDNSIHTSTLLPTTTLTLIPSLTPTLDIEIVPPGEPYSHQVRAVYALGEYIFNEVSAFGHYIVGRITSADLNSDGFLDLIVASEENNSLIQVYENLGNAVFRNSGAVFPYHSSDSRHWNFGIAIADFNQDGLLDIASADAWAGLNIYYNEGRLRFALAQNYTFSGMVEVKGIAAVDLNHDGYSDIILGDHNGIGGVRVLFNDGTGQMLDSGQIINRGDITWDVFVIDPNHDGAPDYLSINRYAEQPARLNLNNGAGIFNQTIDIPESLDDSFDLKCFTHGEYTYCFIANANPSEESQRLNRFLAFGKAGNLIVNKGFGSVAAGTMSFCLADINSDGVPDLVTGNLNNNSLVYFLMSGGDSLLDFAGTMPLFFINRTSFLGCADYNGDSLTDILVGVADDAGSGYHDYRLLLQQS